MWKKYRNRILLYGIGLSLVIPVLILSVFPFDSILRSKFAEIKEQVAPQGVLLDVQDLDFSLPAKIRAAALGIQLQSPDLYLPIFIDEGDISLRLLSLFFGAPEIQSVIKAYRGSLNSSVTVEQSKNSAHVVANLKDVQLGEHPTLRFLGIAGQLSADLDAVVTTTQPVTLRGIEGKLDASIQEGVISQPLPIAPLFSLPPASEIAIVARAERLGDKLELSRFTISCSLGKGAGKGYFVLDSRGVIIGMELNALLSLTDEGHRSLGGYLALAAGEPLDTKTRKWSIKLSQQPGYRLESLIRGKP